MWVWSVAGWEPAIGAAFLLEDVSRGLLAAAGNPSLGAACFAEAFLKVDWGPRLTFSGPLLFVYLDDHDPLFIFFFCF